MVVLTALIGALLGHLCDTANDVSIAVDGEVHDLTQENFAASVGKFPYTFVDFYAPWCGHCKSLEPEWKKTAQLAIAFNIPLAKVDAIAEDKLAANLAVQSFPTLFLFKGSSSVAAKYNGPRDASSMADWLGKWTEAELLAQPEATEEGAKAWAPTAKLKVLGILSGQEEADKALQRLLEAAAFMLNPSGPNLEVPVGLAEMPGGELAKLGASGVSLPCIALMRDFDNEDKLLIYQESGLKTEADELKSFASWLEVRSAPALIPATRETEKLFLKDIDPGHAIAILFGSSQTAANAIHKLAVEMSGTSKKLKWVHAKQDEFGESLAKSVGLKSADFPDFVLWEFGDTEDDDKVFRLSQQDGYPGFPTEELGEDVGAFIENWVNGRLSKDVDSGKKATQATPPPRKKEAPASNPVANVVGKQGFTFKDVQCPDDADIFACSTWCEQSSSDTMKLIGTLGGKPCEEWSPNDQLHDTTTCSCYDEDFTEVYLSCRPVCKKARAANGGRGNTMAIAEDEEDDGVATCAAGDSSCRASLTTTPSSSVFDDDDDIAADF